MRVPSGYADAFKSFHFVHTFGSEVFASDPMSVRKESGEQGSRRWRADGHAGAVSVKLALRGKSVEVGSDGGLAAHEAIVAESLIVRDDENDVGLRWFRRTQECEEADEKDGSKLVWVHGGFEGFRRCG